jgi:hypothetical protein
LFSADNYVTLMPGEEMAVAVDVPRGQLEADDRKVYWLLVQGWNVGFRALPLPGCTT